MKIALIGYGKMGHMIEQIALDLIKKYSLWGTVAGFHHFYSTLN